MGNRKMTEEESKLLQVFEQIIPELSKEEKEKLLWFGEGMAFKINQQKIKAS